MNILHDGVTHVANYDNTAWSNVFTVCGRNFVLDTAEVWLKLLDSPIASRTTGAPTCVLCVAAP